MQDLPLLYFVVLLLPLLEQHFYLEITSIPAFYHIRRDDFFHHYPHLGNFLHYAADLSQQQTVKIGPTLSELSPLYDITQRDLFELKSHHYELVSLSEGDQLAHARELS